jgi:hypothetical protein
MKLLVANASGHHEMIAGSPLLDLSKSKALNATPDRGRVKSRV